MGTGHSSVRKVHMRFTVRDYSGGDVHVIDPNGNIRQREWRVENNRTFERSSAWLLSLREMVREITEPDPPPSFQPVRIWVGTWNMGNAAPDSVQLGYWLGADSGGYDVYAIGLQESTFKPPDKSSLGASSILG